MTVTPDATTWEEGGTWRRVRWLGHSALLVEGDGHNVLIDPFLTGNPKAAAKAGDSRPT